MLTGLLETATGVLAGAPAGPLVTPVTNLITELTTILNTGGGTGAGSPTTPGVGVRGVPKPGTTTPAVRRPAARTTPGAQFTGYRATLSKIKVAMNRRSAKLKVSCPSLAPKGCMIKLSVKASGRKAAPSMTLLLVRNTSMNVTVKLSKATTDRLKKKGGSVQLTASTYLSSLPAVTKSVKVKKDRTTKR